MPEPPDFDQIARQIAVNHAGRSNIGGLDALTEMVAAAQRLRVDVSEQLRLVWNARGAADVAALEIAFGQDDEGYGAAPSMKTLDHALRTRDR